MNSHLFGGDNKNCGSAAAEHRACKHHNNYKKKNILITYVIKIKRFIKEKKNNICNICLQTFHILFNMFYMSLLHLISMLQAKTRTSFILGIMWALAILGFSLSTNYILAIILLLCAGFFDLSFNSMTRTLAQLHAPPEIRGRAIGLFNVGSLGGRTFSGFTVGFGGGLIGIHFSLALSALLLFVCIVALFFWAIKRGVID